VRYLPWVNRMNMYCFRFSPEDEGSMRQLCLSTEYLKHIGETFCCLFVGCYYASNQRLVLGISDHISSLQEAMALIQDHSQCSIRRW
jgi:hypothetical protein